MEKQFKINFISILKCWKYFLYYIIILTFVTIYFIIKDQDIFSVLFFLIAIQFTPNIYLTVKFFISSKNYSFNFLQQFLEIKNLNFQKLICYKDIVKVELLKSANYDTGYNLSFVTFDNYCTFKIYTKDGVYFLNSFYFSDVNEVMTILEDHKIEVIIKNGLGFF